MNETFVNEGTKTKGLSRRKLFAITIVVFAVGVSACSWLLTGNPLSVWQSSWHAITGH